MKDLLSLLIIPASLALFLFAFLSPTAPAALLGAGIGIAMTAVMARRGAIVVVLIVMLLALTACGSDPLGLVAREQIRADAATEIATIEGATTRATAAARMGAAVAIAGIVALAAIAVSMVGGATHIVAQRDRLSMDAWRNRLAAQSPARALPTKRPQAVHWLAITRPPRQQEPPHTLALPARSESHSDIVVIER